MVGFGGGSIGLAVNPPKPGDGVTPIEYMDLTPDEAEHLARLLLDNAKSARSTVESASD